jgi:biotin operon repressor
MVRKMVKQSQFQKVISAITDGQPHTLKELHEKTGVPENNISARIRQLRNDYGFNIEVKVIPGETTRVYRVVK